jgi:holin-like protein
VPQGECRLLGFAIVTIFYVLGLVLQMGLHVPIPANVLGLILFTACLFLKVIKLEWVEQTAEFMIKHMLLFFIPFVVGTMVFFDYIGEHALLLIISVFGSTIGVLVITGWTVRLFKGKEDKHSESA